MGASQCRTFIQIRFSFSKVEFLPNFPFPLHFTPTSGRWEMEGKVVAEYLTVSEVKTHYPFVIPRLSKWSQCCLECVLSPSSCWVHWARQWAALFLARPRQASWMALGVLKGSWVSHFVVCNESGTHKAIDSRSGHIKTYKQSLLWFSFPIF